MIHVKLVGKRVHIETPLHTIMNAEVVELDDTFIWLKLFSNKGEKIAGVPYSAIMLIKILGDDNE